MVLVLACIMIIGAAVPAVALSNQALPAFDRKVTERIETKNILQHIKMLSEDIGPRVMGSSEEKLAAEYIKGILESYGYELELYEFPIQRVGFVVPEVSIIEPVKLKIYPTPISGTALTNGEGVTGQLIDWGTTLTPPVGAAGKIAVISCPVGATSSTSYNNHLTAVQNGGGIGMVLIRQDNARPGGRVTVPASIPAVVLSMSEGNNLRTLMQVSEVTLNINLETNKTSTHVIATKKPVNGNRTKEGAVIVGAHYDSVHSAPGANDNASSVAIMLELARVIANYPIEREIRFIAFGAEEGGGGSRYYVENLTLEDKQGIYAMINMEMLGSTWEPLSQVYVMTVDGNANFITDAGEAAGARLDHVLATGAVGGSDHVPFHNAGIRAAIYARVLLDPFRLESEYHTPEDNMYENISPERLKEAADIVGAAVYDILRPATPNLINSQIRR
jgi:aminopeptidase YwaD